MKQRTRQALAGAAVVASVLAWAAPAGAATRSFDDPTALRHGVDIERVTLVNEKFVRVVSHHQNLRRGPRFNASGTIFVDTDRTSTGPEYALGGGFMDGTDYALIRTDGWDTSEADFVNCHYRLRLDYAHDIVRIRMARGCFDHPGKVRIAFRANGVRPDGDQVHDWLGGRREFTPWVKHS